MSTLTKSLFILACITCSYYASAQGNNQPQKKYTKVPAGYLMVLQEGDSILTNLQQFALAEKIPSAGFTGLGFAGYVKFGFFNAQTKQYEPREFTNMELASFSGSIAWESDKPSIHAHGVGAGKDFTAYGGHILSASVGAGTMEIMITVYDKKLQRKKDSVLGANVLQLE